MKDLEYLLDELSRCTKDKIWDGQTQENYHTGDIQPATSLIDFYSKFESHEKAKKQYDPHAIRKNSDTRRESGIKDILEKNDERHVCIIGSAGSGKTTMLKFIARQVQTGQIKKGFAKGIQIVHFMEAKDYVTAKKTTFIDMLLTGIDLKPKEKDRYKNYLLSNPSKVLFFVDSLDSVRGDLSRENKILKMNEKGSVSTILWNLLSGRFSERFRVISSSRHYSIRNFIGDLRPQRVVVLWGFTLQDMEKVAAKYLGDEEEARRAVSYLKEKSLSLLNMCKTPLFLVFTLMGWENAQTQMCTTATGLMNVLLQNLIHCKYSTQQINSTLKKLEKMAFDGISEKKIMFTEDDLESYQLKPSEISELAVCGPGGKKKKLMETGSLTSFTHLSVQEALAASHASKMEYSTFCDFVDKRINLPHFAIVEQFLSGMMFNEDEIKHDGSSFLPSLSESK